jgi:demethylmenaquinone methyltransferase/2-methoxy-6-polyprenyl-1,4-benzoquinol methylase
MFSAISPRYDLLNRWLSLNLDRSWRKQAVQWCECPSGGSVVDVCAGSGDLVQAWIASAQPRLVVGVDFSGPMLRQAVAKIGDPRVRWIQGDGERLPCSDASFHSLTIGFGLRNFIHLEAGLTEIRRVLAPGGSAVVLELTRPRAFWLRAAYRPYLNWYVPLVGRWVSGNPSAYRYLRDTIQSFADPGEIRAKCYQAGFRHVEIRTLSGGIATLIKATV